MPKPQTLAAIAALALGGSLIATSADAMTRSEFEAYTRAMEAGTVEALNDFLRAHPRSPAAQQVFERINDLTRPNSPAERNLATSGTASIY